MKCKFTEKECNKIYDVIDTLNTNAGIINEKLHFKQVQTDELIEISDIERKYMLKNITNSKNDLEKVFNECGCYTEEPPEGLGKLFDRKFVRSKH